MVHNKAILQSIAFLMNSKEPGDNLLKTSIRWGIYSQIAQNKTPTRKTNESFQRASLRGANYSADTFL